MFALDGSRQLVQSGSIEVPDVDDIASRERARGLGRELAAKLLDAGAAELMASE